jgi:Protein of unknown function (DUF732)
MSVNRDEEPRSCGIATLTDAPRGEDEPDVAVDEAGDTAVDAARDAVPDAPGDGERAAGAAGADEADGPHEADEADGPHEADEAVRDVVVSPSDALAAGPVPPAGDEAPAVPEDAPAAPDDAPAGDAPVASLDAPAGDAPVASVDAPPPRRRLSLRRAAVVAAVAVLGALAVSAFSGVAPSLGNADQYFVDAARAQGWVVADGHQRTLLVSAAHKLCDRRQNHATVAQRRATRLSSQELDAVERTFPGDTRGFTVLALRTYC